MKVAEYNDISVSTGDTYGLVLQHQGISSYSAEYVTIRFQLFMDKGRNNTDGSWWKTFAKSFSEMKKL